MTRLALPQPGRAAALEFVERHLEHLVDGEVRGSGRFHGGQTHADGALASFDVHGYADHRNQVHPVQDRGASGLSPYIRHGLLQLGEVWDAQSQGPERDVSKFRDELLWQEYARHWYGRLGRRTAEGVRATLAPIAAPVTGGGVDPGWDPAMACVAVNLSELHADGWLVNQARMWLASQWSVRQGRAWPDGEDEFFRQLLDGSRAANRLGWQWTTGVGSTSSYGFSRSQVERRAPGLCSTCELRLRCPVERPPEDPALVLAEASPLLRADPDVAGTAGPTEPEGRGAPAAVWLTAESLGHSDPALVAHPDLPAVFVFDEPLLSSLRLSALRLVFLVETLSELGADRQVELHLGRPDRVLADRAVAVTFAPVPGFRVRSRAVRPAIVHPWPWLVRPGPGPVTSFSAWRRSVGAPGTAATLRHRRSS